MQAFVVLLRGINVGGRNILPMRDFRAILQSLGCECVATYIQSGNAVFLSAGDSETLADSIATAIHNEFGFQPAVLVVTASEFAAIAAANPYRDIEPDGKFVHVSFLTQPAKDAAVSRLSELSTDSERFKLTECALYLHAPAGIGRSKLAANVEKCLGVNATSRNRRTVEKIGVMLDNISLPN